MAVSALAIQAAGTLWGVIVNKALQARQLLEAP
jgi:hypothetical protein